MKGYISGQISGLTADEASDLFGRAEAWLLNEGHDPINPLKVVACESEDCNPDNYGGPREGHVGYLHHWRCYMKYDIAALMEADFILMLPNHLVSEGATFEKLIAEKVGIEVWYMRADYKGLVNK